MQITMDDIRGALMRMSVTHRQVLEEEAAERGVTVEHRFLDAIYEEAGDISRQLYAMRGTSDRPALRIVEKQGA